MDNKGEVWTVVEDKYLKLHSIKNIKYDSNNNPTTRAKIIFGKEYLPPEGRRFPSQDEIVKFEKNQSIRINENGNPQILNSPEIFLTDTWTDISGYSSTTGFQTENSEILLQRVIQSATQKGDLVLDFFSGSATTQAVAQKLGRKWLGVEMGDQFNEIDIPRLKNVVYGKQSGISKELKKEAKYEGSGVFKYSNLEQYEQTLDNMTYDVTDQDMFNQKNPFEEYIFYADKKFAHVLELKKNKLDLNFDNLYKNIDFPETISNLLGLPIKKITTQEVILQDGKEERIINYDYKNMNDDKKLEFIRLLQPLLWWGK